jgi:MarR family transcriptional regulator, organic hydroperoxide resistance regulator
MSARNRLPASTAWQDLLPDDRLAHLVRDAARLLTRMLADRLAEHGVPFGHWAFLRVLWVEDGLTQRELAERAGMTEPTTAVALQAMEQQGLVRRAQQGGNRRKAYVYITEAGRALQPVLVPLAEEANAVAIAGAAPEQVAAARALMLRIIENLSAKQES